LDLPLARPSQPGPVGVGVGHESGLRGPLCRRVVAGHAVGVGKQVVAATLPKLPEAVALGAAIRRSDQLAEVVGVLLQRHDGCLPEVRRRHHHAAHEPHGQQRVPPEELVELGPELLR
jgi:hypothetical protein